MPDPVSILSQPVTVDGHTYRLVTFERPGYSRSWGLISWAVEDGSDYAVDVDTMGSHEELGKAMALLLGIHCEASTIAEHANMLKRPPYMACKKCGCTDTEQAAWVETNTNKPSSSEGPTEQTWCPQCEDDYAELVETMELKPFIPEAT